MASQECTTTTDARVLPYRREGDAVFYVGDARAVLRMLPDESVHACITSPPYWGLRDYGLEPQVWGGDPACQHEWDQEIVPAANGLVNHAMQGETLNSTAATRRPRLSETCRRCGAWAGQLGLEPTPELYVQHLVEVFRQVRRVLRKDGTLWQPGRQLCCGTGRPTGSDWRAAEGW